MYKNIIFGMALILFSIFLGKHYLENSRKKIKNIPQSISKILAYGDEYTLGTGVGKEESYPSVLQRLSGKTVIKRGSEAETTASALMKMREIYEQEKPQLVILTLGTGDLNSKISLEETLKNLEKLFLYLQKNGVMVVYGGISPPLVGDNWLMAISQLCQELGVLYVGDIMKDHWDNQSLMLNRQLPNKEGYKEIAEFFYKELESFLTI